MALPHDELNAARSLPVPRERFRALSVLYAELAGRERVKIRPYNDPELKVFSKLTSDQQAQALENMNLSLDVFLEVLAANYRLLDSPQLLWHTLRKLRLTPQSDIFDKITDGDIVEVYGFDSRQLFRNLIFFEFVSMSLEDVYSNSWYQLTRRHPEIEQQIFGVISKLASGELARTHDPQIPEHLFREVDTPGLYNVMIKMKWVSPITSDGALAGFIATNRSRILSKEPD